MGEKVTDTENYYEPRCMPFTRTKGLTSPPPYFNNSENIEQSSFALKSVKS